MTQEQLRAKRAFRIAFDFLNAHLPVVGGETYWLKTAEDVGEACRAADNDRWRSICWRRGMDFWNGWKGENGFD